MTPFTGTTYISAILDRSGSMAGQVDDTIEGYNKWRLATQKAAKGKDTEYSLVLFDDRVERPFQGAIKNAKRLTIETYYARGMTALYDALGGEILRLKDTVKKKDRAIILVMTDGMENASREISLTRLADLVRAVDQAPNWSITFIGANIDTFGVGRAIGLTLNSSRITRSNDYIGTQSAFASASNYSSGVLGNTRSLADVPTQKEYDEEDDARRQKPAKPKNRVQGRDGKFTTNKPKDNRPSGTRGPR